MLIIQISPCERDFQETLSTLNFGQRVSQIEKGQINANITVSDNTPKMKIRSQSQKHIRNHSDSRRHHRSKS